MGDIWFGLRDLLKILGYKSLENAITKININKENKKSYDKIEPPKGLGGSKTIKPHKKFINESGLYQILSISNKPLAKIFMDKYFKEIMPKIRQTGKFILGKQYEIKRKEFNDKLKESNNKNKILSNNLRNIIYPVGKAIYVIIKKIKNKKYYKVGYTKNLNERLKVYNTSFPNKIFFNYFIMVNNKEIDECIKKIMRNEEFIKNKEYYMTSLNKILDFIYSCDKRLNKICCGYCLKCYNFSKIHQGMIHNCKYIDTISY